MELERHIWVFILLLMIGFSSCNWFNPFDANINNEGVKCINYFIPVSSDSSVLFVSNSFNLYVPNTVVTYDLCVLVSKEDGNSVTACKLIETDTTLFWLNTGEITNINPEDTLELFIDSPEIDPIYSKTVVPHKPIISSYSMSKKSYFDGEKYYDEISVELLNPSNRAEAYLVQLVLQVDTVGALSPSLKSLKTDDPNIIIRRFGNRALDNSLIFDDSFWKGELATINFRTGNKMDELLPYHYTLIVSSISTDMYYYFLDLESSDLSSYDGSGNYNIYSNIDGAIGCFGSIQRTTALLFP